MADGFWTADSLFTQGPLQNFGDATFGTDFNDETEVLGWFNTTTVGGAPDPVECNSAAEVGRMVYDVAGNVLYICDSTGTSWASVTLTP